MDGLSELKDRDDVYGVGNSGQCGDFGDLAGGTSWDTQGYLLGVARVHSS